MRFRVAKTTNYTVRRNVNVDLRIRQSAHDDTDEHQKMLYIKYDSIRHVYIYIYIYHEQNKE